MIERLAKRQLALARPYAGLISKLPAAEVRSSKYRAHLTSQDKSLHPSLALFGLETLPLAVSADDNEVAVRVLLHCAGRDHLVDELLGDDSVGVRRLHVLHLRLQCVVLGELGLDV